MKIIRLISAMFIVFGLSPSQTIDLGQDLFFNNEGDIVLCVDAALAVRTLDRPYVMFMMYMGSKSQGGLSVHRDDVVMVYKGQEYQMPPLDEWRKEYKSANHDVEVYQRLGKETLAQSQMRFWQFRWDYDFFPVLGKGSLPADQLSMSGNIGARSKVYFKNPGFQNGDELVIKVKDRKKPDLIGYCAVVLNSK
ncbi:MAG: hypothetical protein H6P98_181 [Candidatus Aminicenantes bacterium]|nr:hypothetical protein [Candidatus Aminicenantes bacterium]